MIGRTVAMIGFGRIGRALVDLMRGFDVNWLLHDPYANRAMARNIRIMPGAIITPHIAGGGRHVREEIARVVLDDLEKFFQGKPLANRVSVVMLDRMT